MEVERGQRHYKGRSPRSPGPQMAMGRIEHTLLDGEFSVRPNRPKTFACNPTIPQKVTNVSIHDKGPEPSRLESSDPMREAGATSTEEVVAAPCCARPTGYSHGRTTDDPAQHLYGAKLRAARMGMRPRSGDSGRRLPSPRRACLRSQRTPMRVLNSSWIHRWLA